VGDERAHAEFVGERQRLSVVPRCVFAASGRRDVSDEAEGVGLVSPSPQSAGECQRLASVAVGLVDPPGARYDKMMEAFGGKGWFVENPKDLKSALEQDRRASRSSSAGTADRLTF
jgi:hypothetical protein